MRIEPIDKPRSLIARLGFAAARRQLGKVPTPFKVMYARKPKFGIFSLRIVRLLESLSIDAELVELILLRSSLLNGCTFCADLHLAQAVRKQFGVEKFRALETAPSSPLFSDAERAALAYVEEVTRHRVVADATFAELSKHFDETEILEITWANAIGNYFNLMAVPLELESDGLAEIALARGRESEEFE